MCSPHTQFQSASTTTLTTTAIIWHCHKGKRGGRNIELGIVNLCTCIHWVATTSFQAHGQSQNNTIQRRNGTSSYPQGEVMVQVATHSECAGLIVTYPHLRGLGQ